jgi:hypothetical protein
MKRQSVAHASLYKSRDHSDRANADHHIHKETNMHNKIDWQDRKFDREVLTQLQNAIRRTDEAIKELESAWGALVVDATFKNMAPDSNYVDDMMCALSDIQFLQYKLDGGQPGPLSNFREVLLRWDHDRIVVPLPHRTAPAPSIENEKVNRRANDAQPHS